jgi:hypothetical protein
MRCDFIATFPPRDLSSVSRKHSLQTTRLDPIRRENIAMIPHVRCSPALVSNDFELLYGIGVDERRRDYNRLRVKRSKVFG